MQRTATAAALCALLMASPLLRANEVIIFNSVGANEAGRSDNDRVAETYIEQYKTLYGDVEVVEVDANGKQTTTHKSPNSTGKNRIVVVKAPTDAKAFLGYVDGSAMNVDRVKDKDKAVSNVLFLGHGGIAGPTTFATDTKKEGAWRWQKDFTKWEKDLKAQGKDPSKFFATTPTVTFGNCMVGAGTCPEFVANIMPKDGKVYAADTLVDVPNWTMSWFVKPDLYPKDNAPFQQVDGGTGDNATLAALEEVAYLHKMLDQYSKEVPADAANKSLFLERWVLPILDEMEKTEDTKGLAAQLNALIAKAIQGTITPADVAAAKDKLKKAFKDIRKKTKAATEPEPKEPEPADEGPPTSGPPFEPTEEGMKKLGARLIMEIRTAAARIESDGRGKIQRLVEYYPRTRQMRSLTIYYDDAKGRMQRTGEQKGWSKNGTLMSHVWYMHDKLHGPRYHRSELEHHWTRQMYYKGVQHGLSIDHSGGTESRITYVVGKQTGPYWRYGGRPGEKLDLHEAGEHKDGKEHGLIRTYHSGGKLSSEVEYQDGVRHGKATHYHTRRGVPKGTPSRTGTYRNGRMVGTWPVYNTKGVLEARHFLDNQPKYWSVAEELDAKGNVIGKGTCKNWVRDGEWTQWRSHGGPYAVGHYKRYTKVGSWSEFSKDGKLTGKGDYVDGRKDGDWVCYYSSGRWAKGKYKKGDKEGPWATYYTKTQLESKGSYRNGRQAGTWIYYKRDGTEERRRKHPQ